MIYWVLLIEVALLVFVIMLMFYIRITRYYEDKHRKERRDKISGYFSEYLKKREVIDIRQLPPDVLRFKDVLPVVENFDRTFNDPIWQASKMKIFKEYLYPLAIKHLHSHIWHRRQLSLRVLALSPENLVEVESVLHLLNDPKYLVRIYAAACLIKSKKDSLILPVLQRMCKETPMARYPYRDLLLKSDDKTFKVLEEIASVSEDTEVVRICLDILSSKKSGNLFPIVDKHIHSSDLECRLAALKLWGALGSKTQREYLEKCLTEEAWQIRAEAAHILGKQHSEESVSELSKLLSDEVWFVRLQAALALKSLGNKGFSILYGQNKSECNSKAYEISQYVKGLP